MDLRKFFSRDDDRKTLRIPTLEQLDSERFWRLVQPILQTAAQQIADSKLIWKWIRYDGQQKLVRWSKLDGVFLGFDADGWRTFLGEHWKIIDTRNVEWAGPSRSCGDRIYAVVLSHPGIQLATFKLQGEMRAA